MKHEPITERQINGGVQKIYRFPNNQGASVIRHSFSYGSEGGLWELAVTLGAGDGPWDWSLDYETPITDDVLGRLTWEQVESLLDQIAALPYRNLKKEA
jgi:hypothetical protein